MVDNKQILDEIKKLVENEKLSFLGYNQEFWDKYKRKYYQNELF